MVITSEALDAYDRHHRYGFDKMIGTESYVDTFSQHLHSSVSCYLQAMFAYIIIIISGFGI